MTFHHTVRYHLKMTRLDSRPLYGGAATEFGDDGQPDLPSGGHAELPGGRQRDYLV